MTRRAFLLTTLVLLLLGLGIRPAWAQEPPPGAKIKGLKVTSADGAITVSFRVDGPFTESVRDKLLSGLKVEFVHRVRITRKRWLPFGRPLAERRIVVSAQYDNLTRQYSLVRTVDDVEDERTVVADPDEMQEFMTRIKGMTVGLPAEVIGKKVTVHVRSEYEGTYVFLLIPWTYSATAEEDVEVTP